jgi:hypothetical protein
MYCWDMRNPGKVLQIFKRQVNTNQRVYFDLNITSNYLASGNHDGEVSVWDLNAENDLTDQHEQPVFKSFRASSDCVNGVAYLTIFSQFQL